MFPPGSLAGAFVLALALTTIGSIVILPIGYLLYLVKTPKEKRYPANFAAQHAFVSGTMLAACLMVATGAFRLENEWVKAVAILGFLIAVPSLIGLGVSTLLKRLDWGQPKQPPRRRVDLQRGEPKP